MRRNGCWTLGLSLILMTGCASPSPTFYGMVVKRVDSVDEAFSNVRREPNHTISFSYRQSLVDRDVTAQAGYGDLNSMFLSIQNGGNTPIDFNYFTDRYYFKTDQGRLYELIKGDILNYPRILNPGESREVYLKLSTTQPDEKVVLFIAELNYGRTILALKPIEVVEVREKTQAAVRP